MESSNELEKIKARYEKRKNKSRPRSDYSTYVNEECHRVYQKIFFKNFKNNYQDLKIIEIGAGFGKNLKSFIEMGFCPQNIFANELLKDRSMLLQKNLPDSTIHMGNALDLPYQHFFDIVFQSTVFTSILDDNFKQALANKMVNMAKKNGLILWYDFKYNNPSNPDVLGIGKREIIKLFPNVQKISFTNVTLAPPIGRRVGRAYKIINKLFPCLRSHVIAEIHI